MPARREYFRVNVDGALRGMELEIAEEWSGPEVDSARSLSQQRVEAFLTERTRAWLLAVLGTDIPELPLRALFVNCCILYASQG